MTTTMRERVRALFHRAVESPADARAAIVIAETGGDDAVRREVESLLVAHEAAEGFLDEPVVPPSRPEQLIAIARFPTGTALGPFVVADLLGAGGMAQVYRARDTRLNRVVAIKVISSDLAGDPRSAERFKREARAISTLTHPHICTLYDIGSATVGAEVVQFLVMELLEGQTLAKRLASGPIPVHLALKIGSEIAEALAAAHARGIVHRDLKPDNIMLTRSGVKLLDFGLASLRAAKNQDRSHTSQGMVFGTLPYMAPEQLRGEETDARSDLFAFGAVLYQMLSGSRPFSGNSEAALIADILEHDPVPLGIRQPLTPPALERLVAVCLAKDPGERWQHAHDVALALSELPGRTLDFRSGRVASPSGEHVTRRPWWPHLAWAAIVLALIAWVLRPVPDPALPPANPVPVIILMDSPGLPYDPATRAAGGTNADDVSDALREMRVVTHKENTGSGWHREEQVLQQRPDLVISHLSSLLDEERTTEDVAAFERLFVNAQFRLTGLFGYLSARNLRTRFLVYSRSRFRTAELQSAWIGDVVARFPTLKGRLFTMPMPGGRATATFRDPATAEELRVRVKAILGQP